MSLTIEQFAAQAECCRMECVAGFGGLKREVNAFSIVDTPEIGSWLHGGELVVDAGYITSEHPELRRTLVAELARHGCAGLGVKLHRYYDAVPPEYIEAGDRLDFPVFALPYEVRFCDLAYEIHKRVFEQRQSENERVSALYARLVHTISTRQDVDRTLFELAGIFGNPVLLANDRCELLALENPSPETAPLADFFPLEQGKCLFSAETMREIAQCIGRETRTHRMTLSAGGRELAVVLAAIQTGERLWGFLIVPECGAAVSGAQYRVLESICPLLALHFAWNSLSHTGDALSEFASKVLLAEDTPPATVQYLCAVNGFDCAKRRICLNIEPEHFDALPFGRRSTVRDLLRSECRRLAERHGLESYPVFFSSYFTVFLLAAPETDKASLSNAARETAQAVVRLLAEYEVPARVGVSDSSTAVERIAAGFRQSIDCIRLGRRLAPGERVYTFDDYQIYCLLSSTMSEADIRALYSDTIEPLDRFDRENHCCYVDTLEAYIKNRFNVTKTAAAMHVHRNTMIYQLDKIRELLALDMDDYENVLRIQMGIHAMRLLAHPAAQGK